MKYSRSVLYSFTTWVLASLLNGLLCGIYLNIIGHDLAGSASVILSIIFSFIYSVPGIILFAIAFVIFLAKERTGRKLFIQLLNTAIISGTVSSLIFYVSMKTEFGSSTAIMGFFGIVSAVTAVFIQRSTFLSSFKPCDNEN